MFQTPSQQFTSLAGISYPVAKTGVTKLTLSNGWASAQSPYGTGDPAYSLVGGVPAIPARLPALRVRGPVPGAPARPEQRHQ